VLREDGHEDSLEALCCVRHPFQDTLTCELDTRRVCPISPRVCQTRCAPGAGRAGATRVRHVQFAFRS
jgi:hypothetical protein